MKKPEQLHPNTNQEIYTPEWRAKQSLCSKRQNNLKKRATKSEKIFKRRLEALNVRFTFQRGFIAGKNFCIVDFCLYKPYKVCIEIDGGYHNDPEQIKRDANRDWYLKGRGYDVIHIKNEDVETFNIESMLIEVKSKFYENQQKKKLAHKLAKRKK